MRSTPAVLGLVLFMMGCAEQPLTEPDPSVGPPAFSTWPDDRYPTEDEYQANGGGAGYLAVSTPSPQFFANNTYFKATASLGANWVNTINGRLTVRLIDGNGNQLNQGEDGFSVERYRPIPLVSEPLVAEISTLNRTCDLTGKSSASASAELNLLRMEIFGWQVFKFWSADIPSKNGELPSIGV